MNSDTFNEYWLNNTLIVAAAPFACLSPLRLVLPALRHAFLIFGHIGGGTNRLQHFVFLTKYTKSLRHNYTGN